MSKTAKKTKYMAGDVRQLINTAIQSELLNLPDTLSQIQDPIKKLEFTLKLMPYICAPIKQVGHLTARREVGEDELFNL